MGLEYFLQYTLPAKLQSPKLFTNAPNFTFSRQNPVKSHLHKKQDYSTKKQKKIGRLERKAKVKGNYAKLQDK